VIWREVRMKKINLISKLIKKKIKRIANKEYPIIPTIYLMAILLALISFISRFTGNKIYYIFSFFSFVIAIILYYYKDKSSERDK
jgi:uncharacterized membrane protein YkvI